MLLLLLPHFHLFISHFVHQILNILFSKEHVAIFYFRKSFVALPRFAYHCKEILCCSFHFQNMSNIFILYFWYFVEYYNVWRSRFVNFFHLWNLFLHAFIANFTYNIKLPAFFSCYCFCGKNLSVFQIILDKKEGEMKRKSWYKFQSQTNRKLNGVKKK